MELENLRQECLNCRRCGLCDTRTNVVFGQGVPTAEVMFVGEGPGASEDEQGLPFVGRSGQLLDHYLEAVDLSRDTNVYIANIVKCRPPQNRDPKPDEREACRPWLEAQLSLLKPKIIVCLGRYAAMEFIDPDFKITRQHGQWQKIDGSWRMAMFHPSALLRDPDKRPETFRDLKSLQAMVQQHCPNTILED